jgi:hypothetical protein
MLQEGDHLFPNRRSMENQIECLNDRYGGDVRIRGLRKLGVGKSRNGEGEKRRIGETDKRKQRSARQEEAQSKHRDL